MSSEPYDQEKFLPGDVVHAEGASAILGDVIRVDQYGGIRIQWRMAVTTEEPDDLVLVQRYGRAQPPADPRPEPIEWIPPQERPGHVPPGGILRPIDGGQKA